MRENLLYSKFAWVTSQIIRGHELQAPVSQFLCTRITLHMGPGGSRGCWLVNRCLCSSGPAVRREQLGQDQPLTEMSSQSVAPLAMAAFLSLVRFQMHRIERLVSPEQFLANICMFHRQHFYNPSVL